MNSGVIIEFLLCVLTSKITKKILKLYYNGHNNFESK